MSEADWHDNAGSVLGMQLATPKDEVLVWYNRRVETVPAKLPEGQWSIGLVSDDTAETPISGNTLILPARGVVALVRGKASPNRQAEAGAGEAPAEDPQST